MRYSVAAAFVLAALLTIVNVSAYQTASVRSGMSVTVSNNPSAGLAISSSYPQKANVTNGELQIDFGQGHGGSAHGLRTATTQDIALPRDRFTARNVFRVTNNASGCKRVSVGVVSGTPGTNLRSITGRTSLGPTTLAGVGGASSGTVTLNPSQFMNVDFLWEAVGAASTGTFTIRVSAVNC